MKVLMKKVQIKIFPFLNKINRLEKIKNKKNKKNKKTKIKI
jgi:hypothetical protein